MEEKSGNGYTARIERLRSDLRAVVEDGQRLLEASVGTIKERAAKRMESANIVVRQHPYPSIAVGFGIGLLGGILLASRRRSGHARAHTCHCS